MSNLLGIKSSYLILIYNTGIICIHLLGRSDSVLIIWSNVVTTLYLCLFTCFTFTPQSDMHVTLPAPHIHTPPLPPQPPPLPPPPPVRDLCYHVLCNVHIDICLQTRWHDNDSILSATAPRHTQLSFLQHSWVRQCQIWYVVMKRKSYVVFVSIHTGLLVDTCFIPSLFCWRVKC